MQHIETFSVKKKEYAKMATEVNNRISKHRHSNRKWKHIGTIHLKNTVEFQYSYE